MIPTVVQVLPTPEHKVYVYFADGQIRLFDMAPLIGKGVFKVIEPIEKFIDCCTVINGTLAWDPSGTFDEYKCLDIDPCSILEDGIAVSDPLSEPKTA